MKALEIAIKELKHALHKKEHSAHRTDWMENKRLEDIKELKQAIADLEVLQIIDSKGDSSEMKKIFEEFQKISGRSDELFVLDFSKGSGGSLNPKTGEFTPTNKA